MDDGRVDGWMMDSGWMNGGWRDGWMGGWVTAAAPQELDAGGQ